jgi:transposase
VASLQEQLAQVVRQIAALAQVEATYPRVKLLDEIPGIGPVTAATVGACLQDKRFAHPDAFVAYTGLDLKVQDSGQSKGARRLTKEGPGELRRLLYLAAQANLRCKDSPFKDQYERERAKGLTPTAALCAVARKLAKVCWSIDKYGTHYQAERVNRPPVRTPAAPPPS